MYKTIIFDFNGTLLDDCELCLDILNKLCKEYGLKSVSMERYKDIFTFPVYLYYKQCGFDVESDTFLNVGKKFHEYYNNLSYENAKLFPCVNEVLNALKSKGYTIVCLSASKIDTLIKQLKYYEIFDYFDSIVGLDNTYAHSKIEVAKLFMKDNRIENSTTLLIGDSIHDLEVANEINVNCYLVSTGHTSKKRLEKVSENVLDDLKCVLNVL